jgi:hypothetical protein
MIRISKSLIGFAASPSVSKSTVEDLTKRIISTYQKKRAAKEGPAESSLARRDDSTERD